MTEAAMSRISLLGITLFFAASHASAQTNTSLTTRILSINHANGQQKTAADVISGASYWFINRQDCGLDSYPSDTAEGAVIRVSAVSNNGNSVNWGSTPQIWIGANCNLAANRSSSTTVPCTRAIGTTAGASIGLLNNIYEIDLAALHAADTTKTSFEACNTATGGGKVEYWVMSASEGTSADATQYIYFYLNGDTAAPNPVTITTTSPSGDNQIALSYSSDSTIETNAEVFYFAIADGCAAATGATTDAGVSDAGTADGGTPSGTAARVAPTLPITGQIPPEGADGIIIGSAGVDGDTTISSSKLGLAVSGDGASLGIAVRDRALNFSVVSNVVCARKIDTYGLCDTADCPHGCAVNPGARVSIAALCAMVATALVLLRRRGLRS